MCGSGYSKNNSEAEVLQDQWGRQLDLAWREERLQEGEERGREVPEFLLFSSYSARKKRKSVKEGLQAPRVCCTSQSESQLAREKCLLITHKNAAPAPLGNQSWELCPSFSGSVNDAREGVIH